jgi:hypothetical protein
LENIFDRTASWRPLRCMMFLNCEWPAMAPLSSRLEHLAGQVDHPAFCKNARIQNFRTSLLRPDGRTALYVGMAGL